MQENILIKGAKVNNLKHIDIEIPLNQFVVITGLSGSGKSSLAFDTLYAEGQRRYVESLSSYARQFLGRINKPEVDYIKNIPPAIAIEQKVNTSNPRSTVGTSTEIYDYLKLLYARIGKTFSPVSGKEVKKNTVTDVVNYIIQSKEGTTYVILAPYKIIKEKFNFQLEELKKGGFTRIISGDQIFKMDELDKKKIKDDIIYIVVDRVQSGREAEAESRYADSVYTAFVVGNGICILHQDVTNKRQIFSSKFEEDGLIFEEPDVNLFSFNNPLGACPRCEGYGKIIGIDEDLVIPNKSLSVYDDAVVCWKGESLGYFKEELIYNASKFGFPIHKPYHLLTNEQKKLLWQGNKFFKGLNKFFDYIEGKKYKIQYRVMLARYRGKTVCPDCHGSRLKESATYVKIAGKAITDLVNLPASTLLDFFNTIGLDKHDEKVAGRLLIEIKNRIAYLNNVGLGYLTLNRLSSTLSGGESQRINLATAMGSSLVGSLYILDEPSIGLHPKDTGMLIQVLRNLQHLGNTVVVVEHDEEIIKSADTIIDIGPLAGRLGGEVVYHGDHKGLLHAESSLTAKYLTGELQITVPKLRRKWHNYIEIKGARENNLKGFDVKIPQNVMVVITGVSGSGKSTLIRGILYPSLMRAVTGSGDKPGIHSALVGDISRIKGVELVDQNPIGKSSRSNPVTYSKAYDEVRKLFARQAAALHTGLTASHFSFNIDGGRCEECQGEGEIKVEMQFMADVKLVCDSCNGKRFKEDVLEVRYQNKTIFDILEMTVDEALVFFKIKNEGLENKIIEKLQPLADVGLGYIKLGQSSNTLSGGESQRVKLASFLSKDNNTGHTLFIFDEPTTGLHFHDINKLLDAFNRLINKGHSLIIIEHNLEVIKNADWVIDLGPGGGDEGGQIVFEGTPEDLVGFKDSSTGQYLKGKLGKK